jgi:hypothetical protein
VSVGRNHHAGPSKIARGVSEVSGLLTRAGGAALNQMRALRSAGRDRRVGTTAGLIAALASALSLIALVGGGSHERRSHHPAIARASGGSAHGPVGLGGIRMPETLAGNVPVKPVRIVLVVGNSYTAPALVREVSALGTWLEGHSNPSTRVTLIDAATGETTGPLPTARLSVARPIRRVTNLATATRAALHVGHGSALIATLNNSARLRFPRAAVLRLVSHDGAPTPASIALGPGETVRLAIDTRRARTFAATVARAVISISHMRERRRTSQAAG